MRISLAVKISVALMAVVMLVSAGLPSQPKYKNLKILPKNITEEELGKVMDGYAHALGVGCDYCHSKSEVNKDLLDCASDKKPEKEMCRKMMTMTSTINLKFFNVDNKKTTVQAVSCMTCHRGSPRPEIVADSVKAE